MNLVILKGRLGADPELRYTQTGTPVCSARLCTSFTFKDKAGVKQENSEWHQLTIWGSRGEAFAKHLKKGGEVCVSKGRLHYSDYVDRENIKRYKSEVIVEEWEFCGSKKDSDTSSDDRPRSSTGTPRSEAKPASAPASRTSGPASTDDSPADFPDDFGGGSDIPF